MSSGFVARRGLLLLVLFAFSGLWQPVVAEPLAKASVDLNYSDNPALAEAEEAAGEFILGAQASLGTRVALGNRTMLVVGIDLEGAHHTAFDLLDEVGAGVSLALRGKLGLGLRAPWWQASTGLMAQDYRFDGRDGLRYRAGLSGGFRLTEHLALELGYRFVRRRADQVTDLPEEVADYHLYGNAFDGDGHSLSVFATAELSPRIALRAGYSHRHGDITSTGPDDDEIAEIATAVTTDPVFGAGREAYRLEADSDIFSAAASMAIDDQLAVSITIEHSDSDGGGYSYANNIAGLGLHFQY
jgi:hypothetical protein